MYNTTTPASSLDSNTLLAAMAFFFIGGFILFVLYAIPLLIAEWQLFKKAGQPGWAAIVPFYNFWVMTKVGGTEEWKFWVFLAGSLAGFIPVIGMFAGIVVLVMEILIIIGFAKRFDRDAGFWVLLYLLPIVGVFQASKANFVGATSANVPPTVPPTTPVAPAPPTAPTPPAPTA